MTSKYDVGDMVVVDFEDTGREICEVVNKQIDVDATATAYCVCDTEGRDFWVQPETILCAAYEYDGELNEECEFVVPVTLTDILTQMREDAQERLEEAQQSVEFETQLLADIGVALEAL